MKCIPAGLCVLLTLGSVVGVEAQNVEANEADTPAAGEPTIIGLVAGWDVNQGLWKPEAESESAGGIILGGFVHARTPAPWFSVRAELTWVQRGVDVTGSIGDDPLVGGIRSDYITFAIHPRASLDVGPIRLHVAGGPTLDQLLQSRVDASLAPVLYRDVGTVFGVGFGAGIGGTVAGRYRIEVEARVFEGLGDAYSGDFVSVRNRSLEFLTRVGVPRPGR